MKKNPSEKNNKLINFIERKYVIFAVILAGIFLRILAAAHGHNYDFESYKIIAEVSRHAGNVYLETSRYNYGPLWFLLISLLDKIAFLFSDPAAVFRLLILGTLTLADLGIYAILFKQFGAKAAALFFLNPLSIIVTGYFSQFDNVAILLALFAMHVYGEDFSKDMPARKWLGLLLLGISITTKHLFFVFPIWIAVKQQGFKFKSIAVILPLALFIVSFIPFLGEGSQGVVDNVLRYNSFKNAPLLSFIFAGIYRSFDLSRLVWFVALIAGAFIFRTKSLRECALMYLFLLLLFSPSVIYHYLAIVAPAIAVYPNVTLVLYSFLGAYVLSLDNIGMNIEFLVRSAPWFFLYRLNSNQIFQVPIAVLFFGFIWIFHADKIKALFRFISKRMREEIRIQRESF